MKEDPTVKSIIQAHVTKYRRAGFNVTRLKGKAPFAHNWQHLDLEPEDFHDGEGIGLHHGPSGTCAIDIDNLSSARALLRNQVGVRIESLMEADDAVQIISGRDNRAKLLYRVPAGFVPRRVPVTGMDGMILELRGGMGCQDVLPPSRHPDTGGAYKWKGNWRQLPVLPKALHTFWQEEMDKRRARQKEKHPDGEKPWHYKNAMQKAEAIAALHSIPATGEVDFGDGPVKWNDAQWVKLGFAFVDATGGGERMFDEFAAWCSEDAEEFDEDKLWARWSSWHNAGGVNAATLFRWANLNSPTWKEEFLEQWYTDHPDERPFKEPVDDEENDEESVSVDEDEEDYLDSDEFKEFAEELEYVGWIAYPGFMTKIAQALVAASPVPRPQLSVFGAIMIMSASLNGHYRWPDGTRMNLYGTALVPTGGGKDILRRGLNLMAKTAGFKVAGRPASRTALHDMLQPYKSVFLEIDEAAHGSIGQESKLDRHKQGLDGAILQAFSASASSLNTSKHAGVDDDRTVDHPYLGVLGLSTAAMYAKTIGEEEVVSGMMNRHLFIVEDEHVDLTDAQAELVFPEDVIRRAKRINSAIGKTEPDDDGVVTRIGDIVLGVDAGAKSRLKLVLSSLNTERRQMFKNDDTSYALVARKFELVKRLAGIFAVWDNPVHPVVKFKHVDWADHYVSISNVALLKFMRKDVVGASEAGLAERVLTTIKHALNGDLVLKGTSKVKAAQQAAIDQGSVSRTTLTNATQSWIGKDGVRTLNNLLELLINQGKIEKVIKKAEGRGRPSESYRLAK